MLPFVCFIICVHDIIDAQFLILSQISGTPSLVRKALYEISTRLHRHPRKENPTLEEIIDASTRRKLESPQLLPHDNPMLPNQHVDHPPQMHMLDPYRNGPSQYPVSEAEEFSIRILCASELIGPVIGKSGANVRQVEQQTGARILVQELAKDASGERLIVISSKEVRRRWLFKLPSPYHTNHQYESSQFYLLFFKSRFLLIQYPQ